jgi:hypothetical protein
VISNLTGEANCQWLEKKMERYRRVAASINDQLTIDRLNELRWILRPKSHMRYSRQSVGDVPVLVRLS